MAASPNIPLNLQWIFMLDYDIRNSRVARLLVDTHKLVDLYRFHTPEPEGHDPTTLVWRLDHTTETYEVVAKILWRRVIAESIVQFLVPGIQGTIATFRQRHVERPNSKSRLYAAGDSIYKWMPGQKIDEDMKCQQVLPPQADAAYFVGSTNSLIVLPEGQRILDQLIVTLMLNLYLREKDMW